MADSNNKRIAKNTLVLYIRMLFLMCISLYTSRVVLQTLGITDYGIYNVVGGIVTMFTMISGSMAAAISRYITYELGKGTYTSLRTVFSSSVIIQMVLASVFIIIAETFGLWFLNNYIVISEGREIAANWVYQFSVITFAVNLISVPYNATIIAHERMNVFAYISIVEGLGKLAIALAIAYSPIDRLIFYSLLLAILAVIVRLIYGAYCNKKFQECQGKLVYEKSVLKQIFSFAGWNIIGASSAVCRDQGGNILLNMFFGPAVNAARGVAMHVNSAIQGFVSNFQMALNPQITKNYATGNIDYMLELVFKGAKYSFYILWLISLPVLINVDFLLSVWLADVPAHSSNFLRIIIVFSLIESLSGPLMTSMYATGKIRNYQIVVGGLQLMNLPLAYIALKQGCQAESVFVVAVMMAIVCLFARLLMLKPMIHISIRSFISYVLIRVVVVFAASFSFTCVVSFLFKDGWAGLIFNTIFSLLITIVVIYLLGINKKERHLVKGYIKRKLNDKNNK